MIVNNVKFSEGRDINIVGNRSSIYDCKKLE